MIAPTRPQNSISVCLAAVAGEAGDLDREDRPGAALADRRQKALEARRVNAGAGAPEVIVDDHDVLPEQLPRGFCKAVLTPPAFVIVQHLVSGRLTNVDEGAAGQVIRSVILTTREEIDCWMTAPTEEAIKLQRPLPDE
jgi:hypothetical protein